MTLEKCAARSHDCFFHNRISWYSFPGFHFLGPHSTFENQHQLVICCFIFLTASWLAAGLC